MIVVAGFSASSRPNNGWISHIDSLSQSDPRKRTLKDPSCPLLITVEQVQMNNVNIRPLKERQQANAEWRRQPTQCIACRLSAQCWLRARRGSDAPAQSCLPLHVDWRHQCRTNTECDNMDPATDRAGIYHIHISTLALSIKMVGLWCTWLGHSFSKYRPFSFFIPFHILPV